MTERRTTAPILETERTILRPHKPEDFDAYTAMGADPLVFRFIGGRARTREESWQRLLRHAGMWSFMGFGYWAIEEKGTGRFLGEAGFHELRRAIEPSFEGTPEAGWGLISAAHGKGLATEVVSRFLAWGDQAFDGGRTVCIVEPTNPASLKVAHKCGYREYGRGLYNEHTMIVLERFG